MSRIERSNRCSKCLWLFLSLLKAFAGGKEMSKGASVLSKILLHTDWKGVQIANVLFHPNNVTFALSAHLLNLDFYSIKMHLKAKRWGMSDPMDQLIYSKQCPLTVCAQNDPDIDFLFTEILPLKGQRGSQGKPWMAAWLPQWLFVSIQLLIGRIIFSSAWVNYHWTVTQGCCCC